MDPVGFGLERYDATGRYRTTEPGRPACAIDDEGELAGIGAFRGPAELSEALLRAGGLDACAARMLYRFALGREAHPEDEPAVAHLAERFRRGGHRLDALLVDLASLDGALVRRPE